MISAKYLLSIAMILPASLYTCYQTLSTSAPKKFEMKTIENTVYAHERFENRRDCCVSARNVAVYATAILGDASFIACGIPRSLEQAYTDCGYFLACLTVTCCLQGIITFGARHSKAKYEDPLIEQMKQLSHEEQDAIILEIEQKNSVSPENILNPAISWLRTCQQKANTHHEHAQ